MLIIAVHGVLDNGEPIENLPQHAWDRLSVAPH
jgi:hypothetical protein